MNKAIACNLLFAIHSASLVPTETVGTIFLLFCAKQPQRASSSFTSPPSFSPLQSSGVLVSRAITYTYPSTGSGQATPSTA